MNDDKERALTSTQTEDATKIANVFDFGKNFDDNLSAAAQTPKTGANPVSNPNRICFGAILNGKTKEEDTNDFPPRAQDLQEFPIWGLPQDLQDVVLDVAKGYKCSPTIPAVAMITTAAAAIGKGCESLISNHHNYPSLWAIIVGTPSTGKSAPTSFFIEPLSEYDEQAENAYNAELALWIDAGRKGQEPKLKQRVIGLCSDEMLLKTLADNNGTGFLQLDEFASMAGSWGRYSKGGNGLILGALESIFSQQSTKAGTIARGVSRLKKPVLTILSTTNPSNFTRIFSQFLVDNGGIFERFLPVFVAPLKGEKRKIRHTIGERSRQVWREYVDRLLRMTPHELKEGLGASQWRIKAEDYWQEQSELVEENEPNSRFAEIQSSLFTKSNYSLYRVALVVAALNNEDVITAPTMRYAAEVAQFFLQNQLVAAAKLLRPEENLPSKTATIRYLLYHYPSANITRLSDALGLGESGRVWLTNVKNGKK